MGVKERFMDESSQSSIMRQTIRRENSRMELLSKREFI